MDGTPFISHGYTVLWEYVIKPVTKSVSLFYIYHIDIHTLCTLLWGYITHTMKKQKMSTHIQKKTKNSSRQKLKSYLARVLCRRLVPVLSSSCAMYGLCRVLKEY
jgi:hypothetical protein